MYHIALLALLLTWPATEDPSYWDDDFSWPKTIALRAGHVLVLSNQAYFAGSEIEFTYHEGVLWANGEIWKRYVHPEVVDTTASGKWRKSIEDHYWSQTEGTHEQKLENALLASDLSFLPPDAEVSIGGHLEITMPDSAGGYTSVVCIQPPLDLPRPEERAREEVIRFRNKMYRKNSFSLIYYGRSSLRSGSQVAELESLFRRAVQGRLTEDDLKFAKEKRVLEPIETIAGIRPPRDYKMGLTPPN